MIFRNTLLLRRHWLVRLTWLVGLLLAAGLLWVVSSTYQARKLQHQHQAERELQTIGRLQAQAVEGWRETRFGDAAALTDDALLAQAVARWRQPAAGAAGSSEAEHSARLVRERLRILQERSHYTAVAYIDLAGQVLLSGDSMGAALPAPEMEALRRAVATATPQAVEPRSDPFFAFPFFSLVAPIFDGTQAIGGIWMVVDVRTSLYPLLSPWPTASKTGESLLVAANGPDALLLTPRRNDTGSGAGTVVEASATTRATVQAVAGARGVIYGEDSNQIPVVAVVNAIPDSPWYLVSQMHVSEAFGAAARRELLLLSYPISLAALLVGVMLGGWQWRARRRESVLKERLAENMQWLESAQQAASIGYFVYDIAHDQFKLSAMAGTLLGLPSDQPLHRSHWLVRVHQEDSENALQAMTLAVEGPDPLHLKYRLQGSSQGSSQGQGPERWIDMWGHRDLHQGTARLTGTVQDITESERAQATVDQYREALEAMVRQDALTGVANRRALTEAVAREWPRAARKGEPLSLLMIDVDFFKRYNDYYGHIAGDDCLRQVARALGAAATRSADVLARYGGEEFAVLLPGTPAADALRMAEQARQQVQDLQIAHHASSVALVVTVSIGIATLTPTSSNASFNASIAFNTNQLSAGAALPQSSAHAIADTAQERDSQRLFHAADRALYAAKEEGRNRVVAHDEALEHSGSDVRER